MKKVLLILLLITGKLIAEEFTWSDYELLCYTNDTEPSYEKYVELVENPQCLIDSQEEIENMMKGE